MVDSASFRNENFIEKIRGIGNKADFSDSDIKLLLINNANDMSQSFVKKQELDNIVNQAVNSLIKEYEKQSSDNYNIIEINRAKDEIISRLLNTELNFDNYEKVLNLTEYIAFEIPAFDTNTRNIRYKDKDGNTVAIIQIDNNCNKIRMQSFGNILPKQEYSSPKLVNYRLEQKAKEENWTTEDGGVNQFDGNTEIRYKDSDGNVMAAIITKPGGKTDTIVEYGYENGKKAMMLHTSQFGHSKTYYDIENNSTKLVIDIDTDGNICGISKGFSID